MLIENNRINMKIQKHTESSQFCLLYVLAPKDVAIFHHCDTTDYLTVYAAQCSLAAHHLRTRDHSRCGKIQPASVSTVAYM